MTVLRSILLTVALIAFSSAIAFAQAAGSIAGQVVDSLGAVVVGATVQAVSSDGSQKEVVTNARGEYSITGLAAGTYTVKAIAPNFALYENAEVVVTAGQRSELIATLTVAGPAPDAFSGTTTRSRCLARSCRIFEPPSPMATVPSALTVRL